MPNYIGRFAPSPTGPLHAGSLVAALASWLDARAHVGQWLVRIEDIDKPRCPAGMDQIILQQLAACGLYSDQVPVWQSARSERYQQALEQLLSQGLAYPCACSRQDVEATLSRLGQGRSRHAELVYPGTCRLSLAGRAPRSWRLQIQSQDVIKWSDRRCGPQQQDVQAEVGDFVLKRFDGSFTYQLAVVVDDAAQGITNVVRGEDLLDNTARQIVLQHALGLPTPRYLHTPLVLGANGEKLSKQNGAQPLGSGDPLAVLNSAAQVLGLPVLRGSVTQALVAWVEYWSRLYNPAL
jgi:glutamyl-Q tRNA(Asp) synthetase